MRVRTTASALALTLLGACGGGGDEQHSSLPQTTVSGTVASNIPLAVYSVDAIAPTAPADLPQSPTVIFGTAGPDGRYSAAGFLQKGRPIVLHATPINLGVNPALPGASQYPRLFSVSQGTTANVTPLTTLLLTRLLNRKLGFFNDVSVVQELQDRPQADIDAARDQVVAYLLTRPSRDDGNLTSPVDVSAVTDFVSTPLSAVQGDPHFEALKRLHDTLMDSETIQGVEEHMLFGNDAPADLRSMLTLDFVADCTPFVNNATVPSGPTRIILDPHGITVGSFDLPFQTGNQLQIAARSPTDINWFFSFNDAFQTGVSLGIANGRLTGLGFQRFAIDNSSICASQTQVSVSGKHPSSTGLIGLLRQSLSLPREFQCTLAVTIPGFLLAPSPNVLGIEANGALRINGSGGPSLHLPSQTQFSVNAPLVVNAGQLSPIRLTSFSADRSAVGGVDRFAVELTSGGQITKVTLKRNVGGPSGQSQVCF
ncbi:MAG TPA: hypothetical protein VE008_06425 [Burkholderiales bacterium]|nr:hypothetical protein [Burkholderiales bacterium]